MFSVNIAMFVSFLVFLDCIFIRQCVLVPHTCAWARSCIRLPDVFTGVTFISFSPVRFLHDSTPFRTWIQGNVDTKLNKQPGVPTPRRLDEVGQSFILRYAVVFLHRF